MANATTAAEGAAATGTAAVEHSDSGVTVNDDGSGVTEEFKPVDYVRGDETRTATSPQQGYALEFDGWTTKARADEVAKAEAEAEKVAKAEAEKAAKRKS